jgi:hypothetical protein
MDKWKPDRSGQFLTVVYKDVVPGDEVGTLHDHPKCVALSWSNALHDVDYLRNRVPQQRTWVGLTDGEIDKYFDEEWSGYSSYHDCFKEVMRWQEAKLKEKNT